MKFFLTLRFHKFAVAKKEEDAPDKQSLLAKLRTRADWTGHVDRISIKEKEPEYDAK